MAESIGKQTLHVDNLLATREILIPPTIFCEARQCDNVWSLESQSTSCEESLSQACALQYFFQCFSRVVLVSELQRATLQKCIKKSMWRPDIEAEVLVRKSCREAVD